MIKFIKEFGEERKKFWLLSILIFFALFDCFTVLSKGSALVSF